MSSSEWGGVGEGEEELEWRRGRGMVIAMVIGGRGEIGLEKVGRNWGSLFKIFIVLVNVIDWFFCVGGFAFVLREKGHESLMSELSCWCRR